MPGAGEHDETVEAFPIAYSTAYLGLAAMLTIRDNVDGDFDTAAVEYATRVCEVIKAQPETILTLPPSEIEATGPSILDNCRAWLD
jgi:hypothetical protein